MYRYADRYILLCVRVRKRKSTGAHRTGKQKNTPGEYGETYAYIILLHIGYNMHKTISRAR